ncbi:MAG: 1,4-alpha-glucan branching protein GlgB [Elusimicrobia bacterium]|nr:1,4-alpha-glucan branching protein GlgB [Candidatus Liberimonas magnetica]
MDNFVRASSLMQPNDEYLFKEGSHFRLYNILGAHLIEVDGMKGVQFAVWAPNAEKITVIGDFNFWDKEAHPLKARWDGSGIWEGFIPGLAQGSIYKYFITSRFNNYKVEKADPLAFHYETPQKTGSIVWGLDYKWNDAEWMKDRFKKNKFASPYAVYEVHLGSWRRVPEQGNRPLNYRETAHELADYCKDIGFTHVEFLPVMEHPFYGSWGYQTLGYFAPTSRFGTPQDFMYLVDYMHQNGIGVILDWVPSHFPCDQYGLSFFDGTNLYEHEDMRKGFHPDWKSSIFNYDRNEVKNFLLSSALFWLDKYHVDGIRVDAVASMLYLDYSRKEGEWMPNKYGGRENIEAIEFLKRFNHVVFENYPDVQTIAEESTAWPMVSKPTYMGGLGFGMKWNMGWMNDMLKYFSVDPLFRKYHQGQITFSFLYAFAENFVLPFSHDEVCQGKGSLVGKMPGDEWQRFANLRALLGYMYGHPGKKLLFMGCEFGQVREWNHDESLEWHVLGFHFHKGIQDWVRDLNKMYNSEPALYEFDSSWEGFEWVDFSDNDQSIISFIRKSKDSKSIVLCVYNFTPVLRQNYRVGVPRGGFWKEMLNSDAYKYCGEQRGNLGGFYADWWHAHGRQFSLNLTIPPLGAVFMKSEI